MKVHGKIIKKKVYNLSCFYTKINFCKLGIGKYKWKDNRIYEGSYK
jgi:hypothetical protein